MSPKLLIHCLVAWIVLWSGPRPIFHNHDQLIQSAPSATVLTRHLDQFHSGKANSLPFGSHCHWLFVAEGILSSADGGNRGQADLATDAQGHWSELLHAIVSAQPLDANLPRPEILLCGHTDPCYGNLAGRSLRQSLCTWTC